MTKRIVIHRDRTFTYDGRTFRIFGTYGNHPENPGWGYFIIDVETDDQVADGYFYYAEIRENFPDDYERWAETGESQ